MARILLFAAGASLPLLASEVLWAYWRPRGGWPRDQFRLGRPTQRRRSVAQLATNPLRGRS